ncbi:heparan-alpha-glucosaminide N-acetyltransferase [Curvibacter sp. APW13]|uniref:DUF1624 domain-containing protein n=1 Tax=Curvibacter sp. APW13 TaxID=3077236 RepID=UPI0028E04ED9|nr:heparan-alpha-glucosaminide N-acetyltransferase [Curvibacter sp. APW13]MDT8991604.1 heparan-alpha-glucosaminide N-acetyltransferase [Curvibacter sp. APW13]
MHSSQRFDGIDSLRGLAMVWMTVFHFSFDLANAGYTQQNFYVDPVWTWQRTCILSLFLLCAGAGQAIAVAQGQSWGRFWRRWAQIAGCALLVSLGSWFMFPKSYIHFGVLHGMAVMLIVARLTAGWGRWLWLAGLLAVASKFVAAYAISTGGMPQFFNEKALNWLGWVSRLPITEDYVPVFPWLGVLWWGMAATQWWLQRGGRPPMASLRHVAPLGWLGRHSLSYYMLHQPIMLGGLALFGVLSRP